MRSIALVLVIAATACGAQSQRTDRQLDRQFDRESPWDKLGERWVDGRVDRDVMPVWRRGPYHRIKLVVENSAVELWDLVVVFGNGEVFSPGTRMIFGAGTTSREIDLPGDGRFIQRIEFRYGNLPGGGRAQLEVWGV